MDHESVFQALDEVENTILEKKLLELPYARPWTKAVDPIEIKDGPEGALDEVVVICPSDDGESGIVTIGWRGPLVKVSHIIVP